MKNAMEAIKGRVTISWETGIVILELDHSGR